MTAETPFTIEQFYKHVSQREIKGGKCRSCGSIHLPPRPMCKKCFATDFEWVAIPQKGKLLTYTIIHVAPPEFQQMTPYAVGIIQLGNNLRLPGLIVNIKHEKIRIGMELTIDFTLEATRSEWPPWSRYCFKPTTK